MHKPKIQIITDRQFLESSFDQKKVDENEAILKRPGSGALLGSGRESSRHGMGSRGSNTPKYSSPKSGCSRRSLRSARARIHTDRSGRTPRRKNKTVPPPKEENYPMRRFQKGWDKKDKMAQMPGWF